MKRKWILAVAALALSVSLFACGRESAPEVTTDVTSEDLNIFLNGETLCDRNGRQTADHLVRNEQGDVLDEEGNVLIAAKNLTRFTWVSSIYYDRSQTVQELGSAGIAEETAGERGPVGQTTFRFRFTVEPRNAVNKDLVLTSSDPGALYFPYSRNKSAALNTEHPEENSLPEITVTADRYNQVDVCMTARVAGNTTVLVKNVLGEVIDRIPFELRTAVSGMDGMTEDHTHRFTVQVIEPSYLSEGYTLHFCEECGISYRDNFTKKLPHEHDFDTRIIPPTYTNSGYTLHVCKICGESTRDTEVPKLECKHDDMKTVAVEPTCTEKGYTLHECQTCRVFSFRGNETDALGHLWDEGALTKAPSCSEEGEKTFTCYRCGETRTEPVGKTEHYFTEETVPPTFTEEGYTRHYCVYCGLEKERTNITPIAEHTHIYRDSVLEPSCTESGYTKHTCIICGESFTDGKIAPLGHDYTEKVTEEPDCLNPGILTFTCSRCGHSYTNNIPALGHAYLYTVIPATRDTEGYTEYTCKRCGDSYRDSYTPRAVN